ncbi:MAG TPA: 30S ribosomal protein S17 [Candidatus Omnitrophota bacterium]|nr:30S ribosomal protein S17 [Candidatus Omnitrophota bacterium]
MNSQKPLKKTIIGTVISDKMDKTVTVLWETRKRHPIYKKFVRGHKKIKAHDEKNEASEGDLVMVEEVRPISKEKTWILREIIQKAEEVKKK